MRGGKGGGSFERRGGLVYFYGFHYTWYFSIMCLVDGLRVDGLVGVVGTCRSMRFYHQRGCWTWRRGMVPSAAASSSVQSQYLVPIHQM